MIASSHRCTEKALKESKSCGGDGGGGGSGNNVNTKPKKTFGATFNALTMSKGGKKAALARDNQVLAKENEHILARYHELEELSVRKVGKLRDKVACLQQSNIELQGWNEQLQRQLAETTENCKQLQDQLDSQQKCQTCSDFARLQAENEALKSSRDVSQQDMDMLKIVVFRLNNQLERYQDNIRKNDTAHHSSHFEHIAQPPLGKNHLDHGHTPVSWGSVNAHTLGPLLDAYEDAIAEKDELIASYESELNTVTGHLKDLIDENNSLQRYLSEDENCSVRLKGEIERLSKEMMTIREQNDLLIKKCALKQDQIQEMLQCYESKLHTLNNEFEKVHNESTKMRTEMIVLKEKNQTLSDTVEDYKNERKNYIPLSVHQAGVNECKKWYEELKVQYEQERYKLRANLEKNHSVSRELETRVGTLEEQLKEKEEHIVELEHSLSEVQLARSACRKQLNKAMNFCKELVSEQEALLKALNLKQHESKAANKFSCDIASRMDVIKNQLKDVQRDAWQELNSVEKRIQEQNIIIENLKQEHHEEISRLQNIIQQQEDNKNKQNSQYALFKEKHSH